MNINYSLDENVTSTEDHLKLLPDICEGQAGRLEQNPTVRLDPDLRVLLDGIGQRTHVQKDALVRLVKGCGVDLLDCSSIVLETFVKVQDARTSREPLLNDGILSKKTSE